MVWSGQVNNPMLLPTSLSSSEFTQLCDAGKIISNHGVYGPKVILMPDGDYIKVFNPKSGFTKRHFFPKYKAFIHNAMTLKTLSVPCITIKQVYFLSSNHSYAVRYAPLPGTDLRTLAQKDLDSTLEHFIPFLSDLHHKGIYFRGIHLANVLQLEPQKYGLIDMADMSFKRGPLDIFMRARNIVHLLFNKDDALFYKAYGVDRFLNLYCKHAKIRGFHEKILIKIISWKLS